MPFQGHHRGGPTSVNHSGKALQRVACRFFSHTAPGVYSKRIHRPSLPDKGQESVILAPVSVVHVRVWCLEKFSELCYSIDKDTVKNIPQFVLVFFFVVNSKRHTSQVYIRAILQEKPPYSEKKLITNLYYYIIAY